MDASEDVSRSTFKSELSAMFNGRSERDASIKHATTKRVRTVTNLQEAYLCVHENLAQIAKTSNFRQGNEQIAIMEKLLKKHYPDKTFIKESWISRYKIIFRQLAQEERDALDGHFFFSLLGVAAEFDFNYALDSTLFCNIVNNTNDNETPTKSAIMKWIISRSFQISLILLLRCSHIFKSVSLSGARIIEQLKGEC